MGRISVGEIQGYEVIYLPEKDYVFCKNTVLPLTAVREFMKGDADRKSIPDKNLVMRRYGSTVEMGCLTSTKENINEIIKRINKLNKK